MICVRSALCYWSITRTVASYRLCVCVCPIVCGLEAPTTRRPRPELGCSGMQNYLMKNHLVVAYLETGVWFHIFSASKLSGDEWSAPRPCRFTPENVSSTNLITDWLDRRIEGNALEKYLLPSPNIEHEPSLKSPELHQLHW